MLGNHLRIKVYNAKTICQFQNLSTQLSSLAMHVAVFGLPATEAKNAIAIVTRYQAVNEGAVTWKIRPDHNKN